MRDAPVGHPELKILESSAQFVVFAGTPSSAIVPRSLQMQSVWMCCSLRSKAGGAGKQGLR